MNIHIIPLSSNLLKLYNDKRESYKTAIIELQYFDLQHYKQKQSGLNVPIHP